MSHFLETFLIAKSFYQLNKYNKAWLNTEFSQNTAFICRKVPRIAWNILNIHFNSGEFFSFTCIYTRRLQKRGFLPIHETGFLPSLKFSTSRFICVLRVLLFSF